MSEKSLINSEVLTHFKQKFWPIKLELKTKTIVIHLILSNYLELCLYWFNELSERFIQPV